MDTIYSASSGGSAGSTLLGAPVVLDDADVVSVVSSEEMLADEDVVASTASSERPAGKWVKRGVGRAAIAAADPADTTGTAPAPG